jgi:hypothetical protein
MVLHVLVQDTLQTSKSGPGHLDRISMSLTVYGVFRPPQQPSEAQTE